MPETTPAQELREAAELLRAAVPSAFEAAVADWLDAEAAAYEIYEAATLDEALKVARAYLGTEGTHA